MSERSTAGDAGRYEIRLKGHLDSRWAAWFDGLSLTIQSDGTTTIHGLVVDQYALHGLLQKVRDTGLPLISVTRLESHQGPTRPPTRPPSQQTRPPVSKPNKENHIPPLTLLLPTSLPDHFVQYLPSSVGSTLIGGNTGGAHSLAPWTGFGVLCGYAVVLIGFAAWRLRRVDA